MTCKPCSGQRYTSDGKPCTACLATGLYLPRSSTGLTAEDWRSGYIRQLAPYPAARHVYANRIDYYDADGTITSVARDQTLSVSPPQSTPKPSDPPSAGQHDGA